MDVLKYQTYVEYLRSPHFRAVRAETLRLAGSSASSVAAVIDLSRLTIPTKAIPTWAKRSRELTQDVSVTSVIPR